MDNPTSDDGEWDVVDEAGYESFPASDPRGWGTASAAPVTRAAPRILVLVTSHETHQVGTRLADHLRVAGFRVTVARPQRGHPRAADYAAVVIGDSWWGHWHSPAVVTYVDTNRTALRSIPTAYFCVRSSRAGYSETPGDDEQFFRRIEWHPGHTFEVVRRLRARAIVWLSDLIDVPVRGPVGGPKLIEFADQLASHVTR